MGSQGKSSFLRICFLLMAALFGLSTSFQFNDPDWYFWIPLYSSACVANLVNGSEPKSRITSVAKFALWLGLFLFFKVCFEDLSVGTAGFWSLNMRERVVRERFGSGLVVISMFLVLDNSPGPHTHPTRLTKYGMPILVSIAYGLSVLFFVFQHHDMKF